ncbi:hypothetical protein L0F63_002595 [Massospora cicadina]|nr:hypothetical protein L0F63_002595 [Massospora cicadina]
MIPSAGGSFDTVKPSLLGVSDTSHPPQPDAHEGIRLTMLEAQQLKRDLLARAIQLEVEYLFTTNFVRAVRPDTVWEGLEGEGPQSQPLERVEIPLMKFFYHRYFTTFPFLANTDLPKFLEKLEKFQDEVLKANLSSGGERSDTTKRKLILLRIQKLLVLLFNNAMPIVTAGLLVERPQEASDHASETTLSSERSAAELNNLPGTPHLIDIVGVRRVTVKGTFRTYSHTKFIIMVSKRDEDETVYSFKRYGDFALLLEKLRQIFPLLELPTLPPKITASVAETQLIREQDRMNLRSLVRRLMAIPEVVGRPEIYQFLTSDLEELSNEDRVDINLRKMHMLRLAEDRQKYVKYLTSKAKEYKALWATCKQELMKPFGLNEFEGLLRTTSLVQDLPPHYLGALEWGRLNFASFLYTFFCTTDDSARFFQSLCSTHKLIPYRTLATTLRFANPTGMVKAVMDLLLAQPFGVTSLLQRMLTTSLSDQARDAAKEIIDIERRIDEGVLCQRIRNFVYLPERRSAALVEGVSDFERLTIIVNDPQIEPELTPEAITRFWNAREWIDQFCAGRTPPVRFAADGSPQYPEFNFLEGLHQLFVLQSRKRDAEKLSELLFQGVTGELMKDLVAMFYGPLAQVYKDANVSDFVLKLGLFIDDLIMVIQRVNNFQANDAKDSECGKLQHFLDLVARHEQSFYAFIHSVYSSNSNHLFRDLLKWVDSLMAAIRDNVLTHPINMQELVDANLPPHNARALKAELCTLAAYHRRRRARQMRNLHKKLADADTNDGFDFDQFASLSPDTESKSSPPFDLGSVAVDDLRELREIDSLQNHSNDLATCQAERQAKINADPCEPMLVWLMDSPEIPPPPTAGTQLSDSNGAIQNADVPSRIAKFVAPKVLAGISQEPYPEGIHTVPSLLASFIECIRSSLKG